MQPACFALAAGLIAMPLVAGAQQIAIKGGLSYGTIPNNGGVLPGRLSAHSGFAFGVGVASQKPIGFGLEGLYAQRGFNSSIAGSSQRFSYVDVPVYLKVTIPTPTVAPFLYAGPQGSFELKCDGGGGACPSGQPKTTFAAIAGGGVKVGKRGGLSLEGRYVYGLTDLKLSTVTTLGNYKSRSFMLLAGIGF